MVIVGGSDMLVAEKYIAGGKMACFQGVWRRLGCWDRDWGCSEGSGVYSIIP